MRYTGEFRDIDNNLHTVNILTNNDGSVVKELKFGETPFITEVKSDDENIFKPVKYSSATISLLTKDLLLDIYSSEATGSKVILTGSTGIEWIGYITPNIYNQDYDYDLEGLDLEAIDGLSILQYIDYKTDQPKLIDFVELISKLLKECDCYNTFYIPLSYQATAQTKINFFKRCAVSESNFFDEDNKAMKCNEVLEELCKFMGVTCTAYKDKVYFLDYTSLSNSDYGRYFKCDVNTGNIDPTPVSLQDFINITSITIKETGTQISLGDTYNKVKVTDSLYSDDNLLPEIDDSDYLTNRRGSGNYEYVAVESPNKRESGLSKRHYDSFLKFFTHKLYQGHYYKFNSDKARYDEVINPQVDSYKRLGGMEINDSGNSTGKKIFDIGATVMKVFMEKDDKELPDPNWVKSIDWENYIFIHNLGHFAGVYNRPLLTVSAGNKAIGIGNNNTYLLLNMSVIFSSGNTYIPITESDDVYNHENDNFNREDLYIEAILKFGNKYFNGDYWVDEETPFKIWFELDPENESKETEHLYNKEWNIRSNIRYGLGLDETDGRAIKLPDNYYSATPPELTFIQPKKAICQHDNINTLPYTGYWIKNFSFKVALSHFNYKDDFEDNDTDTVYENVMNESSVNEYPDTEFKICTWDNKDPNYSSVAYDYMGSIHWNYLNYYYHGGTKQLCKSEEFFINRITKQYSTPSFIIEMTTANNVLPYSLFNTNMLSPSKFTKYIVDEQIIDWRLNTNRVKLVELKE